MAEQTVTRTSVPDEDAGRIDPSRTGRLIAILVGLVLYSEIAPMQVAAVAIIVPKIAVSFPQAGGSITWAATIVGIAGGASMALLGKLGDKIGKRKVTLISGGLFFLSALICASTSNWPLFLFARALGGASAAMTAVEYGLVRDLMPRKWIPVSVGVLGTGFGIGGVVAPLLVGGLTAHHSWRTVFWFLVIYIVATTPVLLACVPETPVRLRQRFDIPGAVLFGVGVASTLIYVSEGSNWGWASAGSLGYLAAGVLLLAAFVGWELRTPEPMLELRLLRAPKVAIPMAAAFCVTLILASISIMVAYMFETPKAPVIKGGVLAAISAKEHVPVSLLRHAITFHGDLSYANGFSVLQMAVHITIWTSLFGMVFGVLGGYLCRRVGCRIPLIISGASMVVAGALWIHWHTTWQEQLSLGVLQGVCIGFYYAATPNLLMDAVPADRQGIAAGYLGVFGAIGTSAGTAIFTAVVTAHPFRFSAVTPAGKTVVTTIPQVYTNTGYSLGYVLLAVVPAAITLVLALALRTGRTPARGGAPIKESNV